MIVQTTICSAALLAAADATDVLCGRDCLFVALVGLDIDADLREVGEALGEPSPDGFSLGELAECGRRFGLHALPVSTTFDQLRAREASGERFACVAHVDGVRTGLGDRGGHFLLLAGFEGDGLVTVVDPPVRSQISPHVLQSRWDGTALLLSTDPLAPEESFTAAPVRWDAIFWAGAAILGALGVCGVAYRRRLGGGVAAGFVGVALLPGCGGAPVPSAPPVAGPPRAHFPVTERDLGQVAVSADGHLAVFPVVNRGAEELRLGQLSVSCNCSDARASVDRLAPGARGEIRVLVTPTRAETKTASVSVPTNDPRRPLKVLRVAWRAVAPRWAEPPELDFGRLRPGQTATRTVNLPVREVLPAVGSAGRGADPGTVGAASGTIGLHAETLPAEPGRGDRVRVTLTAPDRLGRGGGRVTVPLAGGFTENLTVPVKWAVRDVVEAHPPRLLLRAAPGGGATGSVFVSADGPLRIERVTVEGLPNADVIIVPFAEPGDPAPGLHGRARVSVTASGAAAAGPGTGVLRLTLSAPEARTLAVPIALDFAADGPPPTGAFPAAG